MAFWIGLLAFAGLFNLVVVVNVAYDRFYGLERRQDRLWLAIPVAILSALLIINFTVLVK